MKIINSIVVKDVFLLLLRELYRDTEQKMVNKFFTLSRPFKCINLDIKLFLKFYIGYEYIPVSNTYPDQKISFSIKVSVSTESMSLRRVRTYFMDTEHITISQQIPSGLKTNEEINYVHENILDELNTKLDNFCICKECRSLYIKTYKDSEIDICTTCIFDRMFHIQDLVCVICNDHHKPKEQIFTLSCCHTYHSECIMTHFLKTKKRECPLCRELDNH